VAEKKAAYKPTALNNKFIVKRSEFYQAGKASRE
jgi:hypothetical protein